LEAEKKLIYILHFKTFLFKLDSILLLKYMYTVYCLVTSYFTWCKAKIFVTLVVYIEIQMVHVDIT